MIKITINNKELINEISIKGHALYDEYGKDIVCAAVSSIVTTTINAILRIDNASIEYKEKNGVYIKVLKHSEVIDILLINLIDLLENLEKQYPKHIEIRRC